MNNVCKFSSISYYYKNETYHVDNPHYKIVNNEIILSGFVYSTPIEIVFNGNQKGTAYYSSTGSLQVTMSDEKKIVQIPHVKEQFMIDFHKYCCSKKLYKCLRFHKSEKVNEYITHVNNIKNTLLMTKKGVPKDILPNIYKYLN